MNDENYIYKCSNAGWWLDRIPSPEQVLLSLEDMDNFIRLLAYCGMDNASGSSYCNHRIATYYKGVLFISHHHVDHICHIDIAENPSAKLILGSQDSRCYGNPNPSLENSKWHVVWNGGGDIKDGPWVPKIKEVIGELLEKAKNLLQKQHSEYQYYLNEVQKKKNLTKSLLIKNWEN